MAPLSEEEENYIRLVLLLKGVTPRAVRTYFDREFPPTYLPSTLNTKYNTLLDLKLKRYINQAQWNLLIPRNGLSMFISCCNIHKGVGQAVGRLVGETMYQECKELKVKILDQCNQEIILEIKQSLEEMKELRQSIDNLKTEHSKVTENLRELQSSQSTLKTSHNTLLAEHVEVRKSLKEPMPPNIREQIKKQIEDWEKKDKMYVSTRASDYVMKNLQTNSCVTLTAPAGAGKSFISRHTALVLQKEGYKIIPVFSPTDIRDYYQPDVKTVFIVDDICGNFTANQQQIENWKQLLPVINTIIADKCCKIIVSCRLQVYNDDKFNILSPFKSCECNLVSNKLALTSVEKTKIANTYIGKSMKDIDDLSHNCDFFPLLCSLFNSQKNVNVKEYFKNPFDVYKSELDKLSEHGDEGNYKICSLALCVLFNNRLAETWFQNEVTDEQQHIIEDTCDACDINRSTSKAKLKKELDTLDGTYICKQNCIYSTVHDKLFDFLVHYFGQKLLGCLIHHGDSRLVQERFIWDTSTNDETRTSNFNFLINIPDEYLESYLQRLIKDWSAGKVSFVISNTNLQMTSFRQFFLEKLKKLNKSKQVALVNTKDTVLPKTDHGSGNTTLILACFNGFTDMVQWILGINENVDQCRDDGVNGLYMASEHGHTDIVRLLLEKNPNVNLCHNNCCTPLTGASQNGHTDIVKILLEKNCDVNLCDKDGHSPLLQASQQGHTDIVKLLLEKKSDVNLSDSNDRSPLKQASHQGHTDIVKLLLGRNPDVNLCDKDGTSPLLEASQHGHTDIVRLLLCRHANVDLCYKDGHSPLLMASDQGHTIIVKLLLERNYDVNLCTKDGVNPLLQASKQGHTDIVKLLLERNPDVNICDKEGMSPLLEASQRGHTDIVRLLLCRNANVDLCAKDGRSPLLMASHLGHTIIVKLLLERNPDIDFCTKDGVNALLQASQQGHTDIVKLLLERNPDVNLCDKDGTSPLLEASQHGHTGIVRLLLCRNANVDLCYKDGRSPLLMASHLGHTIIVKLLLERNPDIDFCTKDGTSPLLEASQHGHTGIVRLLLCRNANVNLCDKDGTSPLLMASDQGHTIIVKLLLERNPDVDLCTKDGLSSLLQASRHGHTDVVKLLLEGNPDVNLCSKDGCSPLLMASHQGHTNIVKLLLEGNPDVNQCDNAPLSTSYVNNNICISNSPSLVQSLMKHKPDVNVQKDDGGNALYFSARDGNIEITQLLLQNNADSNICICRKQYIANMLKTHPTGTLGELKQNIFDTLVKSTSSRVTEYVSNKSVEYAFDVVAGSSPLHIACFMGRTDVVSCLIDHKGNINMTKEDGTTPLFYACEVGYEDVVRLLLDNGADTQICRMDAKFPLDIATENGHTSIEMILNE